jgi:perosamine synthetase
MTNLQAAVGLAQTERLDAIVAARRRLRALYDARLGGVPGIELPAEAEGVRSVFWMYAIRIGAGFGMSRDALRRELAARGIETRTFFVPIHFQPVYFDQFRGQRFPVAEALCQTGLYLPTNEALGEADVDWIAAAVADIQRRASAPSLAAL